MASEVVLRVATAAEHVVALFVLIKAARVLQSEGVEGLLASVIHAVRLIPGVDGVIERILSGEVQNAVKTLNSGDGSGASERALAIPERGVPKDDILRKLREFRGQEAHVDSGKVFAYVYKMANEEHTDLMVEAHRLFGSSDLLGSVHDEFLTAVYREYIHGNALNPNMFPGLRQLEIDTIAMTANMLNADGNAVGSLTSGGTESILMAMKAYRDRARKLYPYIKNPEVVAPITVHPAFEKAAHYFDLKMVHIPLDDTFHVDMNAMRRAINRNTILLVGSAPQYCYGVIDPIPEMSTLALEKGLPLHVDACFGGFMLPWVEKLGYKITPFDFRNPGVTSMSADIHKYGYGPKGASVVVYRNGSYRRFQYFAYARWPGGLFGSPSMAGTRPGGNIAQAWAALMVLGQEGYMNVARDLMAVTTKMIAGIRAMPELEVIAEPVMTCFAFRSRSPRVDILAVADAMEELGWRMERQQLPPTVHCSIMPHHISASDQFLADLRTATDRVAADARRAKKGSAAMYGMVASIPDKALIDDFIISFFSEVFTPSKQ